MKFFYILIASLLLGIFSFTSCKTSADVMKRRYTKGHYFSKSRAPRAPETKTRMAQVKKNTPVSEVKSTTGSPETLSPSNLAYNKSNPESTPVVTLPSASRKLPASTKAPLTASAARKNLSSSDRNFKTITVAPKPGKVFQSQRTKHSDRQQSGSGKSGSSDVKLVLCVILCFFIPPLAMFLWNEKTDVWFIVDLILFLLLFSFFFWGSLGLAGLASVVIALLRVLDVI
ncbi:MAG: hypothetical protein QM534_18970 [Sediminibacterium sp.]|nr:hypothetical protein [Sediminibacterium sp.]